MNKTLLKKVSIHPRWKLALKTLPFVVAIILFKMVIHFLGYEFLTLNTLFTAIISANIFLIGFLISGVLVDYKESEKIPGDLASSLETMADEGIIIYKNKKSKEAKNYLNKLLQFNKSLIEWFYKKEKTEKLMEKLGYFNDDFLVFESQTQANFIVRLKQEQNLIRKTINRVHTIRETSFLGTGYAIAEIITFILVVGLIFIKIDPFYESLFLTLFTAFIFVYMLFLIHDLDDPFAYYDKENSIEEISLHSLEDLKTRLDERYSELELH
jgi:hypothetical protein